MIFTVAFRDSPRADAAIGWNVCGVILGGLAESLSLTLGFDRLLLVALGFYALSALSAYRLPLRGTAWPPGSNG